MMNLAMNFDTDECLVTAMFDKGNRNDTMEAIDHIIPFLLRMRLIVFRKVLVFKSTSKMQYPNSV